MTNAESASIRRALPGPCPAPGCPHRRAESLLSFIALSSTRLCVVRSWRDNTARCVALTSWLPSAFALAPCPRHCTGQRSFADSSACVASARAESISPGYQDTLAGQPCRAVFQELGHRRDPALGTASAHPAIPCVGTDSPRRQLRHGPQVRGCQGKRPNTSSAPRSAATRRQATSCSQTRRQGRIRRYIHHHAGVARQQSLRKPSSPQG